MRVTATAAPQPLQAIDAHSATGARMDRGGIALRN